MTSEHNRAEVVATVTTWLSERTGLNFTGDRGRWLRDFVSTTHSRDSTWLERLLRGDQELFEQLCTAATVQESYFFREPTTLAFLRDRVLPDLAERPRKVRVWSAGCAGGEEAYTVAMMLAEAGLGARSSVLGTDLVEAAVHQARRGVFGAWSLRGVEDRTGDRRFRRSGKDYVVDPRCCAPVEFDQHNLVGGAPPSAAHFDLVLCRNVLIYLTPDAVRQAGDMMVRALAPGGWLITGVSDPLLDDVHGLESVRTALGTAYRRGATGALARPASSGARDMAGTGVPTRKAQASSRPKPASRPRHASAPPARAAAPRPTDRLAPSWCEDAEHALLMAHPREAERLARAALTTATDRRPAHGLLIRALDADNRPEEALKAALHAIEEFPLAAELRDLLSVTLLQAGRLEEARAHARRALYLDPETPLAHLVLARSAELLGDERTARRARRNGQHLLESGALS